VDAGFGRILQDRQEGQGKRESGKVSSKHVDGWRGTEQRAEGSLRVGGNGGTAGEGRTGCMDEVSSLGKLVES
jgi:hypothetical protein